MSRHAPALGLVDVPNGRSSHARPTPKGGAVGILAAFVVGTLILKVRAALWIPAVVLALVSLLGDRRDLSPRFRLIVQIVAAGSVLLCGVLRGEVPLLESASGLGMAAGIMFFTIFIAGTANFYNFMDGVNGIAAMTGLVAFGLLAAFAGLHGRKPECAICLVLIWACAGFLPFNVPRARVFMGDVGSILLGFVFACLAVFLARDGLDFIVLCACLFPFYADELTTMVIRLHGGESLGRPHRRHLYQLLANECHMAHWRVSLLFAAGQLGVGLLMLFCRPLGWVWILVVLAVVSALFEVVDVVVRRRVARMVDLPAEAVRRRASGEG